MMNPKKYVRQYFMPPVSCMKWAEERPYVDHAPIWCSVDLRDGNQALVVPMITGAESRILPDCWWRSDLRRSRWDSRQLLTRSISFCAR